MNINELLLQEDKNFIVGMIKKIFKGTHLKYKGNLKDAIATTSKALKDAGKEKEVISIINKVAGTKLTAIKDLNKHINLIESKDKLDEGAFAKWWQEAKGSAYGALSFYPMLQMFLELDKVLKGIPDASPRITIIYLLIWVLVISGKIKHGEILAKSKTKEWDKLDPYGSMEAYADLNVDDEK